MKDRIKKLRKTLNMTQQEFADKIGVKRNTIGQYEIGRNEPIDAVVNLICREFDVNETWLRTGEGEMFKPAPTTILDQLAQEYQLSDIAYVIVEKFINLPPKMQDNLFEFFQEIVIAVTENEQKKTSQNELAATSSDLEILEKTFQNISSDSKSKNTFTDIPDETIENLKAAYKKTS